MTTREVSDELRTQHPVKCAIPHEKCGWGAQLPFLGHEPAGEWINHGSL